MKKALATATVVLAAFLAENTLVAAPRGRSINAVSLQPQAKASGLGVNLPLVGRLIGGGNTLFITSVDVTNSTTVATQVDFNLDGIDIAQQTPIALNGSIDASGALVAQGAGTMRARQNAHFDDFIDALVKANLLPASVETNGFVGSVLFIFNGFTKRGQGTATARFSNEFGGGTIGVSLKGHEITTNEPRSLVAAVRDTRGKPGPQLYANVFINNIGLTPTAGPGDTITVQIAAYANSTGQPVGNPITIQNLGPGQTATVGNILQALSVPATEDTLLIYATVTSGNAAIAGLVSQVDATTKDGSAFEMSRADF
jgi:hypothetical protein